MENNSISKNTFNELVSRISIHYQGGGLSHVLPPFPTGVVQQMSSTSISCLSSLPGVPFPPRRCIIDGETVFMAPGEVWVFPAGTTRCFPDDDAGHASEWVHLDFLLEPDWNLLSFFRIQRRFTGESAAEMLSLLRILARGRVEIFQDNRRREITPPREVSIADSCREHQAKFRLLEILLRNAEPLPQWNEFLSAYAEFHELLNWIRQTPFSRLSLESMAQFCNLSRSGFEKRFRRSFGISPGKYLQNYRLSVCEKYLHHSTLSCSEIAEKCGFANVFSFSRAFSEHYGLSPQAFRKKTIQLP